MGQFDKEAWYIVTLMFVSTSVFAGMRYVLATSTDEAMEKALQMQPNNQELYVAHVIYNGQQQPETTYQIN